MRSRSLAAWIALALIASGCFAGRHRNPKVLTVTALTGSVAARDAEGGSFKGLNKDDEITAGSAVRVDEGGSVTLARGDVSSIELKPAEEIAELVVGATAGDITLRDGDALVTSDPSAPITVTSQETVARSNVRSIFRFDRRLKVRIGVYAGAADVTVESGPLDPLPALDEWILNPRIAPLRQPYTIDIEDPWDRRLLADAVQIDEELQPLAAGYEGQFGRRTESMRDLERIRVDSGRASITYVRSYLRAVASSDILIGLVFSLLVERANTAPAPKSFREMIARRRAGASWGLIAHERSLLPARVVPAVACVISLRTGEAAANERCLAQADPGPSPTSAGPQPPPSSRRPSPSPTRTTRPPPPPPPPPTPTPTPTVTPTPTPTCSDIDRLLGNC